MIILRKCEVFRNNKWIECHMREIKKGDKFRLSEPSGASIGGFNQETCWKAASDAYQVDPPGNYAVKV